ncbi:hypothetical protein X777_14301, partial [Ooceraea biroi]
LVELDLQVSLDDYSNEALIVVRMWGCLVLTKVLKGYLVVTPPRDKPDCRNPPRFYSFYCVVKCLRSKVFAGGMLSNVASSSEVNRPSWMIKPPWTPEPRMFGAYSARSTTRNHSITRWFVQRVT